MDIRKLLEINTKEELVSWIEDDKLLSFIKPLYELETFQSLKNEIGKYYGFVIQVECNNSKKIQTKNINFKRLKNEF